MTRDEILAMVPGPEMDAAVGKAIGATPTVKWYAMNKEETAYCMDFERENTGNDWLRERIASFPNSRYEDYHIVRQEIYRQYSKDISEAWDVVEKLAKEWPDFCISNYPKGLWSVMWGFDGYGLPSIEATTAPLAICRAALLAKEVPQ